MSEQTVGGQVHYAPVQSAKLHEAVMEQVQALVATGQLQPGDPLPSQRELALRFRVSHATVKEAMRGLAAKDIVSVEQGRGTFVADRSIIAMSDIMRLFVDEHHVDDLNEARRLIESEVVRLAAGRATEADLQEMRKALEAMKVEMATAGHYRNTNLDFHLALARASHQRAYTVIMELLISLVRDFQQPLLRGFGRKGPEYAVAVHQRILDAIVEGDADGAYAATQDHWVEAEEAAAIGAKGAASASHK